MGEEREPMTEGEQASSKEEPEPMNMEEGQV